MKIQVVHNNKIEGTLFDDENVKSNNQNKASFQLPYCQLITHTAIDLKIHQITFTNLTSPIQLHLRDNRKLLIMITLSGVNKGKSIINHLSDKNEQLQVPFENDAKIITLTIADSYIERISTIGASSIINLKSSLLLTFEFFNPQVYAIQNAIDRLMSSDKQGFLRQIFVSSIGMEILGYFFESMETALTKNTIPTPYFTEHQKLLEAKKHILSHLKSPPTIPKLAKEIGLNEFKLKQGFKALFGETVFGFITNQRMTLAKTMLLNTNKSIEDIAETIGYGYAHHFGAAFKKKFGESPQQFRQKELNNPC